MTGYTNIPLDETINITANLMYNDNDDFRGMTKKDFIQLMNLCAKDNYFIFNDNLYKQIDGCAMGSPISGTLANIFLCYHEERWINNCPLDFKPLIYKRYADDTFIVFKDANHAPKFLEYINNKHNNIKFTMESEHQNKLPFLDLMINKTQDGFSTSIY